MNTPDFESLPSASEQLRTAVRVTLEHWKAVVAILLASALMGAGYLLFTPKVYEATHTLMVVTGNGSDISSYLAADNLANDKASAYSSIGGSPEVSQHAAKELSGVRVLGTTFSKDAGTSQIRVSGRSDTPEHAAQVADAYANGLLAQVDTINSYIKREAGSQGDPVQLISVASATAPQNEVAPDARKTLPIALGVGVIISVLYVLLRHLFDRKVNSASTAEKITQVPILGTIPVDRRLTRRRDVVALSRGGGSNESWSMSEAIRELRTNLTFARIDLPLKAIVVTSSMPGEGKSLVTANLAAAIGATGRPVLIIDADLRRPVQTEVLSLSNDAGLTDVLRGAVSLNDVIQPWQPGTNVSLLSAGRTPPNPSEILGSQRMKSLLDELTKHFFVIIDTPPILPVTDAAVLSRITDGVLVVAQAGRITTDALTASTRRLRTADADILGLVLNQVPLSRTSAHQYGYYTRSYYYYTATGEKEKRSTTRKSRSRGRRSKRSS